jgi:hypothetical protein
VYNINVVSAISTIYSNAGNISRVDLNEGEMKKSLNIFKYSRYKVGCLYLPTSSVSDTIQGVSVGEP